MTHMRIAPLDGLRGVAVIGILFMNIVGFALPDAAYINPDALGPARLADRLVWTAQFILIDGKMRGLFALLFGAGILILAERDPAGFVGVHAQRMFWLLILGLAHFYLLWPGDILVDYALVGLIAALFVRLSALPLLLIAIALILLATLADAALVAEFAEARAGTGPDAAAASAQFDRWLGTPGPGALLAEGPDHRLGWPAAVAMRFEAYGVVIPLVGELGSRLEVLGMMLAGMAAVRTGFLAGVWSAAAYARVAVAGLAVGLPGMAALALWCWQSGFDAVTTAAAVLAWSTPLRLPLIAAYAALLIPWLARGNATRLRATGRAALSNYLGASIAMSLIFEGWGLGLFGVLPRIALVAIAVMSGAVMLFWSKSWLDRFAFGPFEWLWRSLATGRAVQMRRQENIATASQ